MEKLSKKTIANSFLMYYNQNCKKFTVEKIRRKKA